ncbi:MAG: cytochrome c [Acidimicrobiia bacterium]
MSDLAAAAAALGVPEALVRRSAEARAKASGTTAEAVLAAWAGGAPVVGSGATEVASPETQVESREAEDGSPETQVESRETGDGSPEGDRKTEVGSPAAAIVGRPPPPAEVSPKEAIRHPVVVTVATAGLSERTAGVVPSWLAAFLVIIPLFGLFQLASATDNECGLGTELLPDRVTGELVNCDGSPFQGRGPAGGGSDFIALGAELYPGAPACAGCHGRAGEGGTGPPLGGVLATFSSCLDHIEWVSKGTSGFQAEGRTTYGDLGTPVGATSALMPSFAAQLSPEQIAAVVAFERVRFGGASPEETLEACGLVTPAPPEGEPGAETPGGETPVEETPGETTTSTTAAP